MSAHSEGAEANDSVYILQGGRPSPTVPVERLGRGEEDMSEKGREKERRAAKRECNGEKRKANKEEKKEYAKE